jgi:3'-phosphoadenosine 5'-phosphosulfate sulfotransferase (PAPS reductase)/FAD synthetase
MVAMMVMIPIPRMEISKVIAEKKAELRPLYTNGMSSFGCIDVCG